MELVVISWSLYQYQTIDNVEYCYNHTDDWERVRFAEKEKKKRKENRAVIQKCWTSKVKRDKEYERVRMVHPPGTLFSFLFFSPNQIGQTKMKQRKWVESYK